MNNKLISGVLGVTIVVILIATALMPVVSDAQKTAGDDVTLNNAVYDGIYYKKWSGEEMTFQYDNTTTEYRINGELLNRTSNAPYQILVSDVISSRNGGTNTTFVVNSATIGGTQYYQLTYMFSVDASGHYVLSINNGANVLEGTIGWLWYITPEETNYSTITNPTSPYYLGDTSDIVVLGSVYITGDNDTYYAYYDGQLTVNDAYSAVSSVSIPKTLVDGTTDCYSTIVTVTIGDETFTPYYVIAPISVTGHATSGGTYALYGAIPVVIIAALVAFAIGAVVLRRDD